ncbi:MAG: phage portal protein [Pseudomonadota bacterium]
MNKTDELPVSAITGEVMAPAVASARQGVRRVLASYFTQGSDILQGWTAPIRRLDDDVKFAGRTAAARAIDGLHNSGWLHGAVEKTIGLMVGDGLKLSAEPDVAALGWTRAMGDQWSRQVEQRWRTYSTTPMECDAAGRRTVGQMTVQQVRAYYAHGEHLATIEHAQYTPDGSHTKVSILDPLSLPRETRSYESQQGVRTNTHGLPIEYVFRLKDADKHFEREVRVPARTQNGRQLVLHTFDGGAQQRRGITPFAPALRVVRQYDQLADATLTSALIQTIFAATIRSELDTETVLSALQTQDEGGDVGETTMGKYLTESQRWRKNSNLDLGKHGKIAHLLPNEHLEFNRSEHPNSFYDGFSNGLLREVAACVPCSYETLTGDYRGATYSSVRMSTSELWPVTLYRRQFIAAPFSQAVYDAWLEEEVARGTLPFVGGHAAFVRQRAAATRAKWRGPARPTADDGRSANADQTKLDAGLTTLREVCAEHGLDWEEVVEQQAREAKRKRDLGLADADQGLGEPANDTGRPAPFQQDASEWEDALAQLRGNAA